MVVEDHAVIKVIQYKIAEYQIEIKADRSESHEPQETPKNDSDPLHTDWTRQTGGTHTGDVAINSIVPAVERFSTYFRRRQTIPARPIPRRPIVEGSGTGSDVTLSELK